jgi:hypothetical protein
MPVLCPDRYNRIAGGSAERLDARSGGIFGLAMTLLSDGGDVSATLGLPEESRYAGYFLWGAANARPGARQPERPLAFLVAPLPFSTRLLVEFISCRAAALVHVVPHATDYK